MKDVLFMIPKLLMKNDINIKNNEDVQLFKKSVCIF